MNNQQEDGSSAPGQEDSGQTGSAQQGGPPGVGQTSGNDEARDGLASPETEAPGAHAPDKQGSRSDEIPPDATIEGGRDELDINPYGQEPA